MSGRKYRSRAEKEQLVRDYQNKYQEHTKSSYCQKRDISLTSFYKWVEIFGKEKPVTEKFIKLDLKLKTGYIKLFSFNLLKIELDV